MSLQADCPACMSGNHDAHDPKWGIREGLIGGQFCGCTSDCAERAAATAARFDDWLRDRGWHIPRVPSTSEGERA